MKTHHVIRLLIESEFHCIEKLEIIFRVPSLWATWKSDRYTNTGTTLFKIFQKIKLYPFL